MKKMIIISLILLNLIFISILITLGYKEYQSYQEILSDYSTVSAVLTFDNTKNGESMDFNHFTYQFEINGKQYEKPLTSVTIFKKTNLKNSNKIKNSKIIEVAYSNQDHSKSYPLAILLKRNKMHYIKMGVMSEIGMIIILLLLYYFLIKLVFRQKINSQ